MFIRNTSRFRVALSRGNLSEKTAVAAAVVDVAYRIEASGLSRIEEPLEPAPTDPPDISGLPLWHEVSVTVAGAVYGPAEPPFVKPVALTVGGATRRLVVLGDRRWEPTFAGDLVASAPARFELIDLSFRRAFGGSFHIPAGLTPGQGLPHPALTALHPKNSAGVGYYRDAASAAHMPLPNIERPDQLVKRWNDAPEPAGFSACPELLGLRVPDSYSKKGEGLPDEERVAAVRRAIYDDGPMLALRFQHHAPGDLIFPALPAGTSVRLSGVGERAIGFEVPPSPVRVTAHVGASVEEVPPKLRSAHINADAGVLLLVYSHTHFYDRAHAPRWIRAASVNGGRLVV